ncbi:MAG: peptidoglycan editing factor PgeF [Pyrinomonadaceae bacterium]|nr:peptidoglycan editing factor PgeF [Pyrinomonadaceae bacterium]MBP6213456.1 peptidoglycan editing factor PgeF [Pyrinomonadaceae bacterium]
MITVEDTSLTDSGFVWRERDGVKVLVCTALEAAGFANGFSTRLGGVSPFPEGDLNLAGFDEDSDENIYENRRRFLRAFDGEWQLATVWQIHGDDIKDINKLSDIAESDERADAVASDLAGVLAAVKTADCVPVLIGDPNTGAFAAVHAGWRGTVSSIAAKAVKRLVDKYGADPGDMIAAIGPAACGRNYEIGQDVIDAFAANFEGSEQYFMPTRPGHALVDLHQANRDQLVSAGIKNNAIHTAPFCTMELVDLFFSYRLEKRTNGKTGRLLSVIGRR